MIISEYETWVTCGTICKVIQSKKEVRGYTFEYASGNYKSETKNEKKYVRLTKKDIMERLIAKRAEIALRESSKNIVIF